MKFVYFGFSPVRVLSGSTSGRKNLFQFTRARNHCRRCRRSAVITPARLPFLPWFRPSRFPPRCCQGFRCGSCDHFRRGSCSAVVAGGAVPSLCIVAHSKNKYIGISKNIFRRDLIRKEWKQSFGGACSELIFSAVPVPIVNGFFSLPMIGRKIFSDCRRVSLWLFPAVHVSAVVPFVMIRFTRTRGAVPVLLWFLPSRFVVLQSLPPLPLLPSLPSLVPVWSLPEKQILSFPWYGMIFYRKQKTFFVVPFCSLSRSRCCGDRRRGFRCSLLWSRRGAACLCSRCGFRCFLLWPLPPAVNVSGRKKQISVFTDNIKSLSSFRRGSFCSDRGAKIQIKSFWKRWFIIDHLPGWRLPEEKTGFF